MTWIWWICHLVNVLFPFFTAFTRSLRKPRTVASNFLYESQVVKLVWHGHNWVHDSWISAAIQFEKHFSVWGSKGYCLQLWHVFQSVIPANLFEGAEHEIEWTPILVDPCLPEEPTSRQDNNVDLAVQANICNCLSQYCLLRLGTRELFTFSYEKK